MAEIKQLLDRDKSVVNSRNEHGATPLMYASMRNSPMVSTYVGSSLFLALQHS